MKAKLSDRAKRIRKEAQGRLDKARLKVREYHAKQEPYPKQTITDLVRALSLHTDAHA